MAATEIKKEVNITLNLTETEASALFCVLNNTNFTEDLPYELDEEYVEALQEIFVSMNLAGIND